MGETGALLGRADPAGTARPAGSVHFEGALGELVEFEGNYDYQPSAESEPEGTALSTAATDGEDVPIGYFEAQICKTDGAVLFEKELNLLYDGNDPHPLIESKWNPRKDDGTLEDDIYMSPPKR